MMETLARIEETLQSVLALTEAVTRIGGTAVSRTRATKASIARSRSGS